MNPTHDEVWLLGVPSLQDYLDFVRSTAVGGESVSPAALTDEWRAANAYYQELEERESGIADRAERRALSPELAPLAAEVLAHPSFRNTFDTFPTTIEMVELDPLILYQPCVTWSFVEHIAPRLTSTPDPESLFRFCLPLGERETPVQVRRAGAGRFEFRSLSMDVRYHGTRLLGSGQIRDFETFGALAGVVGVMVGFGSNFLNVIRSGNRMVLHDGYHRACALRHMGITHAPAIVQTVTTASELQVAAKKDVADDPDFYFRSARPPLLKDFFDPRIRKVWKTPRIFKVIEVSYEVRDYTIQE